ncbi:MAG: patatin [Cytophagaceae bacterium]|jgi:NTE family protein|nr:patatin [Cytophagaceae bacterium]
MEFLCGKILVFEKALKKATDLMKNICFIFLLLLGNTNGWAQTTYENLVFEGAGIRGLAYSGVIKQLEDHQIMPHIKKVGGTSAGAITALMISLGYDSKEIYEIISTTKFQKFNDGQFIFIGGFSRMNSRYGWYKGAAFIKWLEQLIEEKTGDKDITFSQLVAKGYKELYITGTCLNKQKLLIFSAQTYPNMKIKDAVRISMSVPVYFEAVFIDQDGKVYKKPNAKANLDVVVDGGVIRNFPIFMFDSISMASGKPVRIPNMKTIGIRIDSELQIQNDSISQELVEMPIHNMTDYLNSFYILILENLNRNTLTTEDWKRTISVSSVGISPRIKKLSPAQKQAFIDSGEKYTLAFLQKNK